MERESTRLPTRAGSQPLLRDYVLDSGRNVSPVFSAVQRAELKSARSSSTRLPLQSQLPLPALDDGLPLIDFTESDGDAADADCSATDASAGASVAPRRKAQSTLDLPTPSCDESDAGVPVRRHRNNGGDSSDVSSAEKSSSAAYSEVGNVQSDDRQSLSPQLMASSPDQMQAKVPETDSKQQVSQSNSGSRATSAMTTAPSDTAPRVFSADSLRAEAGDMNAAVSLSPDTLKERDVNKALLTDSSSTSSRNNKSDRKKKSSWYNVLAPTYKSRCEEFKRLFKDIGDEKLVVDYSCALQKDILVHGRLYVSKNYVCFYANIFKWETQLTIRFKDISALTKEKTARVIPNAVQVCTRDDKYFLSSLSSRDKTYVVLFRLWQLALNDQALTTQEFNHLVRQSYGDQLGLESSDDEDVSCGHSRHSSYEPLVTSGNGVEHKMEDECSVNGDSSSLPTGGSSGGVAQSAGRGEGNDEFCSPIDAPSHFSLDAGVTLPPTMSSVVPPSPLKKVAAGLVVDHEDTSDDEGEVCCSGHSHAGSLVLDDVFPLAVDALFEFLFSDSPFFTEWCRARKWTDVVSQPWTIEGNVKSRIVSYTLPLNYSIGPKTSAMTEKQICQLETVARQQYIVDCECTNQGVPYSDSFYVVNRFCLTRVSANHSRLKVHSETKYRKAVWGLVKSFIDRNVTQGVGDSFTFLGDFLHQACAQVSTSSGSGGKKRPIKRRHRQTSTSQQNSKTPDDNTTLNDKAHSGREEFYIRLNLDVLVRVIAVVLLALVLVNALLFYKLTTMEKLTASLQQQNQQHHQAPDDASNHQWRDATDDVDSDSEWLRLLTEQQRLQQVEVQRWRHVLVSSIQIVGQMEDALRNLHDGVVQRSDDIVALIEKAKLSATAHVADSPNAAHVIEDSTSTNSTASSTEESTPSAA